MTPRIMIIDDSAIIRKSLKKVLNLSQIPDENIFEAVNGKHALQELTQHSPDLIFLDINMPEMNGIDFLINANQQNLLRQAKVIVISTEGSNVRAAELVSLGVSLQLRKPVRPEQVAQVVKAFGEK